MIKKLFLGLAISATTVTACNSNKSRVDQQDSQSMQAISQTDSTLLEIQSVPNSKNAVLTKEIISDYLQMKNAFTEDNSSAAASAGKKMVLPIV